MDFEKSDLVVEAVTQGPKVSLQSQSLMQYVVGVTFGPAVHTCVLQSRALVHKLPVLSPALVQWLVATQSPSPVQVKPALEAEPGGETHCFTWQSETPVHTNPLLLPALLHVLTWHAASLLHALLLLPPPLHTLSHFPLVVPQLLLLVQSE